MKEKSSNTGFLNDLKAVIKIFGFFNQRWFQILGIGVILFFGTQQALRFTNNINYVPTILLLGAFLVPAAFASYFYEQERMIDKGSHPIPLAAMIITFLVGGVIGLVVAGLLEYSTLSGRAILNLFGVAVIEEAAKLIFPVVLFVYGRYRSEADGLLFGVTCGMGFAALETMGYGLTTLINSQGDITSLQGVLLIRGLLSPGGHAAWTGLTCAVLWRQRERTGKIFIPTLIGVFILTVGLHGLWNLAGSANQVYVAYLGYFGVALVSLALLISRLRDAKKNRVGKTIEAEGK